MKEEFGKYSEGREELKREEFLNRENLKIVVNVDEKKDPVGLAFVMHGIGGNKEQEHVQAMARAFAKNNYSVVTFDATNSRGESDGDVSEGTITSFVADLEDVIAWAKEKPWYKEPFCLAGHSLGAIASAHFAEEHPEQVKALAPISAVISGKLTHEAMPGGVLQEWKDPNLEKVAEPKEVKRVPQSYMEDAMKYDLLEDASKLTMPVILMAGERDLNTPMSHQEKLFENLPGEKEIHVIKGAEHIFKSEAQIDEVESLLDEWIKKL